MRVLVNGIGIVDSGGVKVFEKLLQECVQSSEGDEFVILLTRSNQILSLVNISQS